MFERLETMGHERVLVCSNPEVGLKAIIAVHSTVLGPGLGGCRMWPYESFDEALDDVLRLSRGMTYKAAVTGLNLGGGKAVIIGDSKSDKSEELLRAFGRHVDSLGGLYITAEDMGMGTADMDTIRGETPYVTGVSLVHGGSGNPSPVTALGVYHGMKGAAAHAFGDGDRSLAGKTVAIEGLGSVGRHLARLLIDEGARVLGCDVDADALEQGRELGVEIVDTGSIADQECDVFSPCARGASINPDTIPRLKARVVAGAANNQLADETRDGAALAERGILYAPDYVINAGGLINVYEELNGYDRDHALSKTERIGDAILEICQASEAQSIPTYEAANQLAEQRIERIKSIGARHWTEFTGDRGHWI